MEEFRTVAAGVNNDDSSREVKRLYSELNQLPDISYTHTGLRTGADLLDRIREDFKKIGHVGYMDSFVRVGALDEWMPADLQKDWKHCLADRTEYASTLSAEDFIDFLFVKSNYVPGAPKSIWRANTTSVEESQAPSIVSDSSEIDISHAPKDLVNEDSKVVQQTHEIKTLESDVPTLTFSSQCGSYIFNVPKVCKNDETTWAPTGNRTRVRHTKGSALVHYTSEALRGAYIGNTQRGKRVTPPESSSTKAYHRRWLRLIRIHRLRRMKLEVQKKGKDRKGV